MIKHFLIEKTHQEIDPRVIHLNELHQVSKEDLELIKSQKKERSRHYKKRTCPKSHKVGKFKTKIKR